MECAICGRQIDSVESAIKEGWIPVFWDGENEWHGPACPECTDEYLLPSEDLGGLVYDVRPEFSGGYLDYRHK